MIAKYVELWEKNEEKEWTICEIIWPLNWRINMKTEKNLERNKQETYFTKLEIVFISLSLRHIEQQRGKTLNSFF